MRELEKIKMKLSEKRLPRGERKRLKELSDLITQQLMDSRSKTVILPNHPTKK